MSVDGALVTYTHPSVVGQTKLMKTVFYYYYIVSIPSCLIKSLISNERVIHNIGIYKSKETERNIPLTNLPYDDGVYNKTV
jgi:hypothetical protein